MGVIRKTKSVNTILNIFEASHEAISVVDLINRLDKEMNKTTIYRILERLDEDGILHSFLGKDGVKWYSKCQDCSSGHHHDVHPHFQCNKCGKTECLAVEMPVPEIAGKKIDDVQVLMVGLCESCA